MNLPFTVMHSTLMCLCIFTVHSCLAFEDDSKVLIDLCPNSDAATYSDNEKHPTRSLQQNTLKQANNPLRRGCFSNTKLEYVQLNSKRHSYIREETNLIEKNKSINRGIGRKLSKNSMMGSRGTRSLKSTKNSASQDYFYDGYDDEPAKGGSTEYNYEDVDSSSYTDKDKRLADVHLENKIDIEKEELKKKSDSVEGLDDRLNIYIRGNKRETASKLSEIDESNYGDNVDEHFYSDINVKHMGEGNEKQENRPIRQSEQVWDGWSHWSTCSTSCGTGRSYSWRHCLKGCSLGEKEARIKFCNTQPCPRVVKSKRPNY